MEEVDTKRKKKLQRKRNELYRFNYRARKMRH